MFCYLIMILIRISLMITGVEYLFMCLFVGQLYVFFCEGWWFHLNFLCSL